METNLMMQIIIKKMAKKDLLKKILYEIGSNLHPISAAFLLGAISQYTTNTMKMIIDQLRIVGREKDIIEPQDIIFTLNKISKEHVSGIKPKKTEEEKMDKENFIEKVRMSNLARYLTGRDTMGRIGLQSLESSTMVDHRGENETYEGVTKKRDIKRDIYRKHALKMKASKKTIVLKPKEIESQDLLVKAGKVRIIRMPEKVVIDDKIETFMNYFVDRYLRIRKILVKKGLKDIVSVKALDSMKKGSYLIVIIREKRILKNKTGLLVGEDTDGQATILVPLNGDLAKKFFHVLLDSVIAVKISKVSNGYCIAEDIVFPDIPRIRERHRSSRDSIVAFIADTHIGSKQFLGKELESFINFVQGECDDNRLKKIAKETRYVIINGDITDGVGVYPDQKSELAIFDIYEQYELAAEYFSRIPESKSIIIIPGNHDGAGKFIPQPPIPKEIAKPLYDLSHVYILGNPSLVDIEGVKLLLYHGYGLEHIAAQLEMDLSNPTRIHIELLRLRHLMPEWGRVPIAPVIPDSLVIEEIPDIFVTSHLHIADIRIIKGGVLSVSTGAFQDITSWQRQLGIEPTIGIVPLVNLRTYEVHVLKCDKNDCYLLK